MPGKLGRTSEQRLAILRNQASSLLWYGKIETTKARAKELKSYVEKIITAAINTYDDTIESTKVVTEKTGKKEKEVTVTVVKDGPKKLAARRRIMAKLYDLQEIKAFNESKSAYKARTADVAHPLIEKLFNEIAPKYAQRNDEKNCAGGYTRIKFCGSVGTPPNLDDLTAALNETIPAHLSYQYQYRYLLIREIHGVMTISEIMQTEIDKFARRTTNG